MMETKATPLEVVTAFDEFMMAFQSFKEANDRRLQEIEDRLTADSVSMDKVERISQVLDEQKQALARLTAKGRRPPLELGAAGADPADHEHKTAFDRYMRTGETGALPSLETRGLTSQSVGEGYLVPIETETEIGRRMSDVSLIRAISGLRQVSSAIYRKPFSTKGPATGWVGETDARPETNEPELAELEYPVMELYAMPAASQSLLDDSAVNMDEWIASEVDTVFAEQESAAFVAGDGNRQPRGFLTYPQVDEAAWSWGNLGVLTTGTAGAFPAIASSDVLVDVVYALRAGYRQNAHFVMNRKTQAEIRKIKDGDGNYIWQPPSAADGRATIMNFPVAEAEDMPDLADNSLSIAFGDFARGYLIVDRQEIRVLRDPYSQKPFVLFYTTKRVGGGVHDFNAIKLIRFGS